MRSGKSSEYRGVKNINEHLFKILSKCKCNKLFLGFIFAKGFSLWLILFGKYAVYYIKSNIKVIVAHYLAILKKCISDHLTDSFDVQDFNIQPFLQVQFIFNTS